MSVRGGPLSGGTLLSFNGTYLNTGNNIVITLQAAGHDHLICVLTRFVFVPSNLLLQEIICAIVFILLLIYLMYEKIK